MGTDNILQVPADATASQIKAIVDKLNMDDSVHGVLVQMPLGENVGLEGEREVMESVSPKKDVDGSVQLPTFAVFGSLKETFCRFHAYNIGHLSSRSSEPLFTPCTPSGVLHLLSTTGIELTGANVVVLGRSDIVGNPVAAMLRKKDATVTQCHSKTPKDVMIAAVRLISRPRRLLTLLISISIYSLKMQTWLFRLSERQNTYRPNG